MPIHYPQFDGIGNKQGLHYSRFSLLIHKRRSDLQGKIFSKSAKSRANPRSRANARQVRFGIEGITSTVVDSGGEVLYVIFQREWADDPEGCVRIGRYDIAAKEWTFYYYPIEAPLSPNGGWVGLSDLVALGEDRFAVIERDNQAGPDAAIKRIYAFSIAGLAPLTDAPFGETPAFPVVKKTLMRDLLPDLQGVKGLVLEKIEGLTVLADGTTLVVNDNESVDGSNGETQLLRFPDLFK